MLVSEKKGIYITGPNSFGGRPENAMLANHLLGPVSYPWIPQCLFMD
jgi:hypothetical protein